MTKSVAVNFIETYRNFVLNEGNRKQIKTLNRRLKEYKYILVYPFYSEEKSNKLKILVGFSNEIKVFKLEEETMQKAMKHVEYTSFILSVSNDEEKIEETLVFETSNFEPIPVEDISWDNLLNAPAISLGDFSLIQDSFLEFFNLTDCGYENEIHFSKFFLNKSNKPEDLELKVVWCDVDSDQKYGYIITLVCWKNQTIGWISTSGKWLDSRQASTINPDIWIDMMNFLYEKTGFTRPNNMRGVSVYDITKDKVDDVCIVPGVSTTDYN